ncbi:hypothetical protein M23134_04985 [Microscilla marina ATCC 23134]|uniref:Uncharacterized protein n=1 Tax=Microscilla marina ATCC 23134 TaxID=313606 RepID=A1ZXH8_MICM2|nr:hypothetical protein M23134_04985 [Microscilla marina ATCC 23134]
MQEILHCNIFFIRFTTFSLFCPFLCALGTNTIGGNGVGFLATGGGNEKIAKQELFFIKSTSPSR